VFHKADYDYAAWWTKYELQPGIYEVENWSNLPYYRSIVGVKAVVIEDNFRSHAFGHYGDYDQSKNTGRVDYIRIGFPATYSDQATIDSWLTNNPTFRLIDEET
jgi:hypothetical protein